MKAVYRQNLGKKVKQMELVQINKKKLRKKD